jgi:nucleoside-diphosphate-sugar epimerase
MRVVLTGSSGRVGRAIFNTLAGEQHVLGLDRLPSSTTRVVGDFTDDKLLKPVLEGADAVIHVAALHAPHVQSIPEEEFRRVNVEGTRSVAEAAISAGVQRLVFTSTTALFGNAISVGSCTWIDEETPPLPKSIYHRTKLEAERVLEDIAGTRISVRVLRMSRSFPEPADVMSAYRLHRGIDVRDVADAHAAALTNEGPSFQRFVISAATPFLVEDCPSLAKDAASVIELRAPALAAEFKRRNWKLPSSIDRVYCSRLAEEMLGWRSRYGFDEVLAQLDRRSLEVLPSSSTLKATFD